MTTTDQLEREYRELARANVELVRERDALRAQVEKWCGVAERQEVEYGEQAKQLAAMRAMLERCQYGRDHRCPICGEYERNIHAVDCELRSLLYGGLRDRARHSANSVAAMLPGGQE